MADDKVTGSAPDGKGPSSTPPGIVPHPQPAGASPALTTGPDISLGSFWPMKIFMAETWQMVRWMIGVCVLLSAWALIWFVYSYTGYRILATLTALLTFAPFLYMETRDFWLSRMLGLRVKTHASPWISAGMFWALGPISLFLRPSADPMPTSESESNLVADPNPAREVVETIVFVVVLVLLLKSFIAEAFVIPTGSMAETLYGYQKVVTCPSCGYVFPVNCSQEVDPQEPPPIPVTGCTCPNCRQAIRMIPEDGRRNRMKKEDSVPARTGSFPFHKSHPLAGQEYKEIVDPGWNSGDRVLVGKFLYEFGDPKPLDVVVFKYPAGPQKNHVPMNYIKRLIGMPEQTVGINRGDVFALGKENRDWGYPEDASIPENELWNPHGPYGDPRHTDDPRARAAFKEGKFERIRKTPAVILAMQRIVYDNDHQPSDLRATPELIEKWQRWVGESQAWVGGDNAQSFRRAEPGSPDQIEWLKYRHRLRAVGPQESLISDFSAYNHDEFDVWSYYDPEEQFPKPTWVMRGNRAQDGFNWVGDLILEAEVEIEKPNGAVVYQLNRGVDRFQLIWDLDAGTLTLTRITVKGGETREEILKTAPMKAKAAKYHLRLANVDERLTVWVNDDLPFGDGVIYQSPTAQGPHTLDLEPAKIGAKGGAAVTVRHIKLWRDTYYIADSSKSTPQDGPGITDWTDPTKWNDVRDSGKMPITTYFVHKGHYLCMGDNSPASADSRTWGLVPQRLMLGRALLVYWPYNRMGRIR